jgi:hypothetical protein
MRVDWKDDRSENKETAQVSYSTTLKSAIVSTAYQVYGLIFISFGFPIYFLVP